MLPPLIKLGLRQIKRMGMINKLAPKQARFPAHQPAIVG